MQVRGDLLEARFALCQQARDGFAHRLFEIVRLPQLGKQRARLAFHHLQQRVVRLAQRCMSRCSGNARRFTGWPNRTGQPK